MVSLGGIQQQQRVSGRRGVQYHKGVLALGHRAGKGAKHRDFLRARRPQILRQQRPTARIKLLPGSGHDGFDIHPRLGHRINPAHLQPHYLPDRRRNMRRRIGGAQMHSGPAPGQFGGNGGGNRGFAHPAFTHGHDYPMANRHQFIHQRNETFLRRPRPLNI